MQPAGPNEQAPDAEDTDPDAPPLDPHPDTPDEGEGEEIGRESVEALHEESVRDDSPVEE